MKTANISKWTKSWTVSLRLCAIVLLLLALPAGSYGIRSASAQSSTPLGLEKIGPGVLETIQQQGEAHIVIALNQSPEMSSAQSNIPELKNEVASLQTEVLSALSPAEYRGEYRYEIVPGLAGTVLSENALMQLAANPNVRKVDLDVGGIGHLATSVPQIGADQRHSLGNTGEGVVVAFLDSGVDTNHPDLSNDLNQQACFGDNNSSIDGSGFCPGGSDRQTGTGAAEDGAGHGTHTAGIVTSGGAVTSQGVAPGANIVAIKVLDNCSFSGCFYAFSEIVAALDYIIANNATLGVDVINMSIGTSALFAGSCDNSTAYNMNGAAAINTLRANGVIAFASSGNNGSGTQMTSPACLSNVVSVGAVNSSDTVAGFTNSNAATDILAPGVSIVSDAIGGGTTSASGTSMASPHAAGCAALLIEAGDATTPGQIETYLKASTIQITDAKNGLTFPRIDCSPDSPVVASVLRADPSPTSAASVNFTVTFSRTVTGVNTTAPFDDFALYTTGMVGTDITGVSGSGTTYTVTVTTGSGNGKIRLDVVDDDSILDEAGTPLGGVGEHNGDFSGGQQYSITRSAPKPGVPVLLSPASGALVNSLQPVLDWRNSNPTADHYQIQIASNKTFTMLVANETNLLVSTFTPAINLLPGKLYYWRVRAFNVYGGASAWSTVWSFKTPLSQPTLVSPTEAEALTTDRPSFEWSAVDGAASYVVQVSAVSNFSTLLLDTTSNETEYSMTKDLPQNKTLFWRVRAKSSSAVAGPWSLKGTFKTGNPPTVPVLVAPTNGALLKDYTPEFNWNNASLPAGTTFKYYEIQWDEDKLFTSPVTNTTTLNDRTDSDFTPLSDLASNTKYYWRVRSVNTIDAVDHTSGWSPVWSVRTILPAPTGLTVTPNGLKPSFSWDAAAGPGVISGYTIQISTSSTFSTLIVNSTTQNLFYNMTKNLPSGKTIYWRVRVNGANGPSAWAKAQFVTP